MSHVVCMLTSFVWFGIAVAGLWSHSGAQITYGLVLGILYFASAVAE